MRTTEQESRVAMYVGMALGEWEHARRIALAACEDARLARRWERRARIVTLVAVALSLLNLLALGWRWT
jgi:hypothetical protein